MTEKLSNSAERAKSMSPEAVANEVQLMVRKIGDGIAPNTTTSERCRLIARVIGSGVTAGQVKRMFYGEWLHLPAHVFLSVRNAYGQHLERARKQAEHEAALYRALQEKWESRWGDSSSFGCGSRTPEERPDTHSTAL